MPEWVFSALASAGIAGIVQIAIGMKMLGTMTAIISHLQSDVKDMQRTKLDREIHDLNCKRLESDIAHVDDKHDTRADTLDHKVNGVSQRVGQLEARTR